METTRKEQESLIVCGCYQDYCTGWSRSEEAIVVELVESLLSFYCSSYQIVKKDLV